jgi:hypothetical protein
MIDGTTVTRQDGNACWAIAVFSGEAGRVPNNGYVFEWGSTVNGFTPGKSLQMIRNGANNTVFVRNNGTSADLQVAYSTGNKNVILFCDRGPGTNVQYSVNGGALTNGPLSSNTGYQNGCTAIGGPAVTASSYVAQQWNAPIATVAWWVGAPVDMPTNALLKQISDQLWVS